MRGRLNLLPNRKKCQVFGPVMPSSLHDRRIMQDTLQHYVNNLTLQLLVYVTRTEAPLATE